MSSDPPCPPGEGVVVYHYPYENNDSQVERALSQFGLVKDVSYQSWVGLDVDKPLSFLTIYNAPFRLSDLAIIKRLSPYCEVLHYRRGKHSLAPNIYNSLRHYRVRISKPIPSFLRFGKFQIFVKHNSQVPTCRKCNCPGHFSNVCPNRVCFNCEGLGHEACDCLCPVLCCICKKEGHMGINCTYSWF